MVHARGRELWTALNSYHGPDPPRPQAYTTAFTEVVAPWLESEGAGEARTIARLAQFADFPNSGDDDCWLLCELYALSRVSDSLLPAWDPDTGEPAPETWELDPSPLTRREYVELFTAIGMRPFEPSAFHPVLCEITEVVQASNPETPIEIAAVDWPGLMLGELVFNRAGVRIWSGRDHATAGIADRSTLYWAYDRRHRLTYDLSRGWGSNSQWNTGLRCDYITADTIHLNVAGRWHVDEPAPYPASATYGSPTSDLSPRERHDLLLHRCLVRQPNPGQPYPLATSTDLWPFDWTLTLPRHPF
jgi:hypothetical protein